MSNKIARHWIDGAWVESNRVGSSTNPSNGETLGQFADGGADEARAAIAAARRAFDTGTWAYDRNARAAALYELAQRIEAQSVDQQIDHAPTLQGASFAGGSRETADRL